MKAPGRVRRRFSPLSGVPAALPHIYPCTSRQRQPLDLEKQSFCDASAGDPATTGERAISNAAETFKKPLMTTVIAWATFAMTFQTDVSAATLDDVKKRGTLQCDGNGQLPGCGLPDAQGNWAGLDVDLCRAVAAAIFNDPNKVKFVALTAKDRFTALQSGDVDLLARNTTWISSRDTQLGLNATAVNYFDGQGFIIRKDLKVNSALELNDATVCVQQGTTTELNL